MSNVFRSCTTLMEEAHSSGHKQLKEEVLDMRSALKRTMDQGLAPAEMETARALVLAVDAADAAIDKMYAKLVG